MISGTKQVRGRAFDGSALVGDRLVRFVFLDESGFGDIRVEPVFVVAGVIVDADRQWRRIEERLKELADSYVPEEHRPDFVFHATEIFSGGKVFDRITWPKEARWALLHELLRIPAELKLPIVWTAGPRAMLEAPPFKNKLDLGHCLSVGGCAHFVQQWMEKNAKRNEVATIIAENTNERRALIKTMFNEIRSDEFRAFYERIFPEDVGHPRVLNRIVNSVLFAEKAESAPLQLADLCAFTLRRYFSRAPNAVEFFEPLKRCLTRQPTLDFSNPDSA